MNKLILSTLCFILVGCTLSPPTHNMTHGKKIDTSKLKMMVACETKKSELIKLFGKPSQEGRQSGYDTLIWNYLRASFSDGAHESQYVIVFLNDHSTVIDYALNPVGLVQISDNCK
jgi:hypothetical protein